MKPTIWIKPAFRVHTPRNVSKAMKSSRPPSKVAKCNRFVIARAASRWQTAGRSGTTAPYPAWRSPLPLPFAQCRPVPSTARPLYPSAPSLPRTGNCSTSEMYSPVPALLATAQCRQRQRGKRVHRANLHAQRTCPGRMARRHRNGQPLTVAQSTVIDTSVPALRRILSLLNGRSSEITDPPTE